MKPRVRVLTKTGDADRCEIQFFSQSGLPVVKRLVQLSNLQALLVERSGGSRAEMAYQVSKAVREFNREVAMGYWP